MKILFIHNYYQYYGGEETYFHSVLKLLKEKGHKVKTYTKDSKDIKTTWDKIKVGIGLFWNKQVEMELSEIIKDFKPDIAHINNIYPLIGATVYSICSKYNIPVIQRMPDFRLICPKGILYKQGKICELCIYKSFKYPSILNKCYHNSFIASFILSLSIYYHNHFRTFKTINKYVFQADFIQDFFIKHTHIPLSKTVILPHFVHNAALTKADNGNYFLFVGRLSEEKNIIPLLKIFAALPNIRLKVIGDGPLRSQVQKYSIYKNIEIKGHLSRSEVLNYMKNALFTIIPSHWYETGPFVLMESYSVSTPVIAPRLGVFNKQILENKTGLFYNQTNYQDLKNKILTAYNNPQIAYKMRKYVKREFNTRYTDKKHYSGLMNIYTNSINEVKNHVILR